LYIRTLRGLNEIGISGALLPGVVWFGLGMKLASHILLARIGLSSPSHAFIECKGMTLPARNLPDVAE